MQSLLQDIIAANIFAFLLIFMRFGTALLIMPGIGDSFVSPSVRLSFALGMSLVVTPVLSPYLPAIPGDSFTMVALLLAEAVIGFFIGTVMRILIGALDTAGMVVSMQSGLASAMLFNPVTASQGSLIGAVYSSLGVTLLFVTNMHHYMLASVVESYQMFPASGQLPETGALLEVISRTVAVAFKIGVQIAIPFLIVGTLLQIGLGLLGRLMPQVQVFFIAMPVQIFLSLIMLAVTLSAGMLYWLSGFESIAAQALSP